MQHSFGAWLQAFRNYDCCTRGVKNWRAFGSTRIQRCCLYRLFIRCCFRYSPPKVLETRRKRPVQLVGTLPPPCSETEEYRAILVDVAYKTHLVLDHLGVEHWLMYGSLWGPLRGIQEPLPWDFDVDFGINGSNGIFNKLTWKEFKAKFSAVGMRVFDHLKSSSLLTLRPQSSGAKVDVFLFYDREGYMMRSGYETWLFFINYLLYHRFPSRLVQKPLPKVKFGHFNISVPREGIEIMKYLYRFDWWKVVKPVGCQ